MPNYCENDLRVEGDRETIGELISFARDGEGPLSFDKFIPYPQEFKDRDEAAKKQNAALEAMPPAERAAWVKANGWPEDGFNSGGYGWFVENWGTKWPVCRAREWKVGKESALLTFSTAWTPPLPVIRAIARKFPGLTLTLRYYERGAAFQGILQVKGGEVLEKSQSNYDGERGG